MFGFISMKKHREIVSVIHKESDNQLDALQEVVIERDAALAELSKLKAARARSNANLIPGGPKQKAEAKRRNSGDA